MKTFFKPNVFIVLLGLLQAARPYESTEAFLFFFFCFLFFSLAQ